MSAVTHHGELRARKRLGINKKSVGRLAEQALAQGIPRTAYTGTFRRYLDANYFPYKEGGTRLLVHAQNLFVFSRDDALVTTWPLPSRWRKHAIAQRTEV